MYEEKIICSHNWSREIKKKLSRIASILEVSESELSEQALVYFFEHSDVCKKTQAKIREHDRFLDGLVRKRHEIIEKSNGTRIYQFRPEISEDEEDDTSG